MKIDMSLFDFFKLPMQSIVAICITTGLILFLPDNVLSKIYLSEIKEQSGYIFGILFVLSISILIVSIIYTFYSKRHNRYYATPKLSMGERLSSLNSRQKLILLILRGKINNTLDLPINDADVYYLEKNEFIFKVSDYSADNIHYSYTLNSFVLKRLTVDVNDGFIEMFEKSALEYYDNKKLKDDWVELLRK